MLQTHWIAHRQPAFKRLVVTRWGLAGLRASTSDFNPDSKGDR